MKPNTIEKQFREKLNSQEIQPSQQAWDRLDAMLSVAEEKKTKRSPFLSFQFIGIAASILVFVTVGTFFYNQKSSNNIPANTVVINEQGKDSVMKNTSVVADKEIVTTQQTAKTELSNKTIIAQNEKSFIRSTKKSINQKTNNPSIINKEKAIEYQNSGDVALKDLPKIESSKEIIISKSINSKQNTLVSSETTLSKSDTSSKVKVNANSLLSEVDSELELTFREKVFKRVTKNYKEVKVALANRNLEQ